MINDTRKRIVILIGVIILLNVFEVFYTHGKSLFSLFFYDETDTFMDFLNSIGHVVQGNLYENKALYPPLTYVILLLFSMIIPQSDLDKYFHATRVLDARAYQGPMLATMIFIIICVLMVAFCIFVYKKGSNREKYSYVILSMFSIPILYALERGNMVILAFIFAFIFFIWKDSDNRILRELAFISLAVSAGIKIYPAIFGIMLIAEKRYKEAIRTVIYGIILFLTPFMLFGGLNQVITLVQNIFSYSGEVGASTAKILSYDFGFLISIMGNKVGLSADTATMIALLYKVIFIVTSIFGLLILEDNSKKVLLLTVLMIGLPGMSFTYMLIFLLIPFIMILNKKVLGYVDIITCLLLIFVMYPIPFINNIGDHGRKYFRTQAYSTYGKISEICFFVISILLILYVVKSVVMKLNKRRIIEKA